MGDKKVGIMQPYFLPYIGYWQLINAVDIFVIYDNIQYTKKGWINRNRILLNGHDALFSIPVKKDSDFLNVSDRYISTEFDKIKLIAQIRNAYFKAPFFKTVMPLIEKIIEYSEDNLFNYVFNSVKEICNHLHIKTELAISSTVAIDHSLKAENKVIALCKAMKSTIYINSIGGITLYSKDHFENVGLTLRFLKSNMIEYKQFENAFIPWLSIVDVLMFNSIDELWKILNNYQLFSTFPE